MVSVRWLDEVVRCPYCGNDKVAYLDKAKLYFCSKHKETGKPQKFSLKLGTIFEESPIGLDKWLPLSGCWLIARMEFRATNWLGHSESPKSPHGSCSTGFGKQ